MEEIILSLINCPECKRENVSSSAEMCPKCGFGIKKYCENLEKEKSEEEQDIEDMKSIPLPPKPEKPLFFFLMDPFKQQKYYNALQMYELSQKDPIAYKKRILEAKRIVANAEAEKWLNRQKCPICGSDDIKTISIIDRTISVTTIGLASNKIGKQYQCRKCKHLW